MAKRRGCRPGRPRRSCERMRACTAGLPSVLGGPGTEEMPSIFEREQMALDGPAPQARRREYL